MTEPGSARSTTYGYLSLMRATMDCPEWEDEEGDESLYAGKKPEVWMPRVYSEERDTVVGRRYERVALVELPERMKADDAFDWAEENQPDPLDEWFEDEPEVMTDGGVDEPGTERDWSDHYPTDPELISGMLDGFTLQVNETQLHFRCREHFPMLVEIYVGDEEKPIGAINTAKEETVALGGVSEGLADRVDRISEMPVDEIPGELEKLAYRLNPSGREGPEADEGGDRE